MITNKINQDFTRTRMRRMLNQIAATPRKWYHGTRTFSIKHLFRYECIVLCYLWLYGTVPTLKTLNNMDKGRLMKLFIDELNRRGIKSKHLKCNSRYNVSRDSCRYEFSRFRMFFCGVKLLDRIPTKIDK